MENKTFTDWMARLHHHTETIKCPECGLVQDAKVVHTEPWDTRIHDCVKCEYVIMESEWEQVSYSQNLNTKYACHKCDGKGCYKCK
jgi:hypothetical protein